MLYDVAGRYAEQRLSDDVAISVNGVSKKFRLFDNPGDRLKEALHPLRKVYHRDFWALRDISFDIRKGETVGILGRNGSGKSTLLQLICGIMQPTSGRVDTRGRISALLELGAGFNPEFSGRDNVILNGAIMGFTAEEMKERMPQIEAFADVGNFFDQPVKTYSSGMFVRVAFAAAINIDPEILVVDEALSVGDAKFQHKCYSKIDSFRKSGKTIILVTHDISQVTAHCDRAILIDRSRQIFDGHPREVVDRYVELMFADEATDTNKKNSRAIAKVEEVNTAKRTPGELMADQELESRSIYCKNEARYGNRAAEIVDCVIEVDGKPSAGNILSGSRASLHIKLLFHKDIHPSYGFGLKSVSGVELYGTNTFMKRQSHSSVPAGSIRYVKISFDLPLRPGDYFIDLGVTAVDGSDGGLAADVRRSSIMITLTPRESHSSYNGMVDLVADFSERP
jgi:lipopolysaccharide transport system ATP-binding protein